MRERREYVRANGLVLVNYRIPELHLEGKSSAYDVSGGGLRITVDKKLKTSASVEVEIYLPGSSQPILAKGEIAWSQKCKEAIAAPIAQKKGEYFYAGIKFTVIDQDSKNRIVAYVHRRFIQEKEKV